MTTVCWKDGVLASDSRSAMGGICWSVTSEKLIEREGWTFGISGDKAISMKTIRAFLYHVLEAKMPIDEFAARGADPDDDSVQIVVHPEHGAWTLQKHGADRISESEYGCWAIGSGRDFALGAMLAGATAEEAVAVASRLDPWTGGAIQSRCVISL